MKLFMDICIILALVGMTGSPAAALLFAGPAALNCEATVQAQCGVLLAEEEFELMEEMALCIARRVGFPEGLEGLRARPGWLYNAKGERQQKVWMISSITHKRRCATGKLLELDRHTGEIVGVGVVHENRSKKDTCQHEP